MTLELLAPGPPPRAPSPGLLGAEHRSRHLLARVLEDGDEQAARQLVDEYDGQAPAWRAWTDEQVDYLAPLDDALRRAPLPAAPAVVLEVGCGTGEATQRLVRRFGAVLATDVSRQMLQRARDLPRAVYAAADARRLPLRAGSVDVLVGLNAVPDVDEWARVLRVGGRILWVSSYGVETPLYTDPRDLARRWPGPATSATAGHGDWLCLLRA